MNIKVPIPDKDYRVLVRCATYNQSKYICDALNGFAIQETEFPFICIVVDDASKDGNQEVIRQYANDNCDMSNAYVYDDDISVYIRVSHKTNTNCVYLFCFLKVNLYCKQEKQEIYKPYRAVCEFEAICEGDDYWIDENKLQMQVDVMETNPEVTICYCRVQTFENKIDKSTIPYDNRIKEGFITLNDYTREEYYCGRWCFHTSSFLIRTNILFDYINTNDEVFKIFPYGDMPTQLFALCKGNGYFIDKIMSKYRLLSGGYNSFIQANPQKGVLDEKKLIYALEKFDLYTKFAYHKAIKRRIKYAHIRIVSLTQDKNYAKKYLNKIEYILVLYPRLARLLSKIKKN